MTPLKVFDSLPALLRQRVEASPAAIAYVEKDEAGQWQTFSWQKFDAAVEALAARLASAGIESGDQVAILMPNGVQWEIIQHAAFRLGAIVVGLDLNDPAERMADIFTLCAPAALLVDHSKRLKQIPLQGLKSLKLIVAAWIEGPTPEGVAVRTFDALPGPVTAAVYSTINSQTLATIIFTSGTTGRPKALSYAHGQLAAAIAAITRLFVDLPDQAHTACWLPLANPFQRMINYCALAMNWKAFMVPAPATIMAQVPRIQPHLFAAVPRFYEKLFDGIRKNIEEMSPVVRAVARWAQRIGRLYRRQIDAGGPIPWLLRRRHGLADRLVLAKIRSAMGPNLRYFLSGSAALRMDLIQALRALGFEVLEAYGISENIIPMAMNAPGATRNGSVGRPLAENTIRMAADGEVLVTGVGMAREAVEKSTNGFWHTGDIGRLDADGFLWLTGRKSDLFKLSTGRKVAPRAIEEVMDQIPGVEHSVAVGQDRKHVVALLNVSAQRWQHLNQEYNDPQGALRFLLSQTQGACAHLPHYCQPVEIMVVNEAFTAQTGELTANLKLRRHVVLQRYAREIDELYREIDGRRA